MQIVDRVIIVAVCTAVAVTAIAGQPKPTIKVTPNWSFTQGESPSDDAAEPYITWSSTNAEHVLIIGYDNQRHPPSGKIDSGGSYVFVAVGPGGRAAEAVGAFVKGEPGPGYHGLVYKFDSTFDVATFFRDSAKYPVGRVKPDAVSDRALAELQRLGYIMGVERTKDLDHPVIYTVNYNFNPNITSSPSDKGEVQRQIAFVLHVGRDLVNDKSEQRWLYIQPLVQKNYPRDNDKWLSDPDALQVGKAASQSLASVLLRDEVATEAKP